MRVEIHRRKWMNERMYLPAPENDLRFLKSEFFWVPQGNSSFFLLIFFNRKLLLLYATIKKIIVSVSVFGGKGIRTRSPGIRIEIEK